MKGLGVRLSSGFEAGTQPETASARKVRPGQQTHALPDHYPRPASRCVAVVLIGRGLADRLGDAGLHFQFKGLTQHRFELQGRARPHRGTPGALAFESGQQRLALDAGGQDQPLGLQDSAVLETHLPAAPPAPGFDGRDRFRQAGEPGGASVAVQGFEGLKRIDLAIFSGKQPPKGWRRQWRGHGLQLLLAPGGERKSQLLALRQQGLLALQFGAVMGQEQQTAAIGDRPSPGGQRMAPGSPERQAALA